MAQKDPVQHMTHGNSSPVGPLDDLECEKCPIMRGQHSARVSPTAVHDWGLT